MSVMQQCPACHFKQSLKNTSCTCGEDLEKAKRSKRVDFWITYRLKGKQIWNRIGKSISEAKAAEGLRRSQKHADPLFDIKPDNRMTFQELSDWYVNLERVKALASFRRISIKLERFNEEFGSTIIRQIQPAGLENLQIKRKNEGLKPATIDDEIGQIKTMIKKAHGNGMISEDTLGTFFAVKKLLKKGANARDRILTLEEFDTLLEKSLPHLKGPLLMGYFTGMRKSEILGLERNRLDLEKRKIRLRTEDVKNEIPRNVPIPDRLYYYLITIPPALHDPHVFLYQGKPMKEIKKVLKAACKDAGILYGRKVGGGFTFHDLRHTFNTNMRKAGVPESVVMKITGHETREMFDRYNTVDEDDAEKAVNKLESYLEKVNKALTKKAEGANPRS